MEGSGGGGDDEAGLGDSDGFRGRGADGEGVVGPVPQEPLALVELTTRLELTVIFPAVVVRLTTDELAVKNPLFPFLYPEVNGSELEENSYNTFIFSNFHYNFQ